MKYRILVPFATLKNSYSEGDVVEDLEDGKNLAESGLVELVESVADLSAAQTVEPAPAAANTKKKRGK